MRHLKFCLQRPFYPSLLPFIPHSRILMSSNSSIIYFIQNDDIYIHRRKLQEVETELDAVQPLPGPQLEDKSKGSGRGRSRQPDEADLGPEHRAFLQKSEEQYLSETYINEEPLDKKGRFYKSIRIPPVLPGAPPSKRRTPANPMRDSFFAPPLALSNAVRAADPPDRNYMTSEDFALLMWYTRTIPYCGAVGTSGAIQKFNAEYSAYRWNWARTHGVCLRPLASIQERWTRHILPLFEGTEELPDGNFRLFVAQSGFFTFSGNFIVGYNISAIKQANIQCLTNLDANPELDPYTANLPNENKIYRQNLDAMAVQFGEELLHEGQRWIPDQE